MYFPLFRIGVENLKKDPLNCNAISMTVLGWILLQNFDANLEKGNSYIYIRCCLNEMLAQIVNFFNRATFGQNICPLLQHIGFC